MPSSRLAKIRERYEYDMAGRGYWNGPDEDVVYLLQVAEAGQALVERLHVAAQHPGDGWLRDYFRLTIWAWHYGTHPPQDDDPLYAALTALQAALGEPS